MFQKYVVENIIMFNNINNNRAAYVII